jgi:hypothetical protein
MFGVELQSNIVPLRIRRDEVVGLPSMIVDINQPRREDLPLAIDAARGRWNIAEFFANRNASDFAFQNEEFAFEDEVGKSKAGILEKRGGGVCVHGERLFTEANKGNDEEEIRSKRE